MSEIITSTLHINGEPITVAYPSHHTLLEVLREECGLPGTKHGCELGECGTCSVLLDGVPVLSCLMLAQDAMGCAVETVEGLETSEGLHPLQVAFADLGAAQCGYCTPGLLMVSKALLDERPIRTTDEVKEALAGNLCRCTGYHKILQAVELAGRRMSGEHDAEPLPAVHFGIQHDEETICGQ